VTAATGTVDADGVIHTFKATAGKKDVRFPLHHEVEPR